MPQLKPALTYQEQIDRLKNVHNLTISDDSAALKILKESTIIASAHMDKKMIKRDTVTGFRLSIFIGFTSLTVFFEIYLSV